MSKTMPSDAFDTITYSDSADPDYFQLPDDNDPAMPDRTDVFEKPITSRWTRAELSLYQRDQLRKAKVFGRSKAGNV